MPPCSATVMASHGTLFLERSLRFHSAILTEVTFERNNGGRFLLGMEYLHQSPTLRGQPWRAVASLRSSESKSLQLNCRAMKEQQELADEKDDDSEGKRGPLSPLVLGDTNAREIKIPKGNLANTFAAPGSKDEDLGDRCSEQSVEVEAPSVATGSVFGAMALITGSSVGAGILALPAITAPTGFLPSAVLMSMSWAFLLLEALLLAEVNVKLMQRRQAGEKLHSEVLSLRTMAEQTMGPLGGMFTTVTYLILSYTLMVAYIAKSGEVLSLMLNIPIPIAGVIFTFGFGGLLYIGDTKTTDTTNQVLTIMLIGLFLLLVVGGASIADWTGLEHVDWNLAPQTLPIIFLALVYHDLIPVVCSQLGGDMSQIRKSIILGSSIPLAMFLSWDAVALCLAPLSSAKDPIDVFMRVGGPGPAFVVEAFALLAIATSFIGTVLGLSEFLLEQIGKAQSNMARKGETVKRLSVVYQAPRPISKWFQSNGTRALSFLLVLAPPFIASSTVSDAFFSASDFAGAYGMTSLYGVIPPVMVWSLHRSDLKSLEVEKKVQNEKTAPGISILGGKLTLASISVCATAMILGQLVLDIPQFLSSPDMALLLAGWSH